MCFYYNISKDIGESPFEEEAAKMSPKEGGKKERRGGRREERGGVFLFQTRASQAGQRDRRPSQEKGGFPPGLGDEEEASSFG